MSFQVTVLKVLAGHPDGRVSLADLKHAVAILISSGTDWTDRTKRLAVHAPGLDIFSQALVLRDIDGWQITDAGRTLLTSIETRVPVTSKIEQTTEVVVEPAALPTQPRVRLVSTNRREPRPLARCMRISAVA